MQPTLSIIIVNYNVRYFIKRTLESIEKSKVDFDYDVYVVDNNSIDGSVEMIARSFPDVHLIANSENVGFSIANNQAIKQSKSKYVLVLNPDTVIEENTLQICHDYMESNTGVGALGVKMIDGSGKFLPESKRALPSVWNSFTKLSGLSSLFPNSKTFNGYALGHLSEDEIHSIEVLCGAFMFMRKSVLDTIGAFDERFFMYGEDIDLSKRIVEAGNEIHYIPDTSIIHYKGESTKKASLSYVKTFYNAMGLYVDKHYGNSDGKFFSKILSLAIWLRASISGLKRLLENAIRPVVDGALISIVMYLFARFWATYYFDNSEYYEKAPLDFNILTYVSLWIIALWFIGYYIKVNWKSRVTGIAVGLVFILTFYALLPLEYRTSRVIILVGTLISFVVTAITGGLWNKQVAKVSQKKILIVAKIDTAKDIMQALTQAKVDSEIVGIVNPEANGNQDLEYVNDITQLRPLSKVLKADEIIFSTEDLSMKDIMKQMVNLDSRLSFKIAGDDSLSIIGSNSKNEAGELYTVKIDYNLEEPHYRHIKRSIDIVFSLLFVILSPILLFINQLKIGNYFSNMLQVLFGKKTLVGYAGNKSDFQNLPEIKTGIIVVSDGQEEKHSVNFRYAKSYNILQELEIIYKNINHLSG